MSRPLNVTSSAKKDLIAEQTVST